jgi:hypothetical protein
MAGLRYQDIILDFSKVKHVDASLMLPLSSYTTYYSRSQLDSSLVEPSDPVLRRLFVSANWAHYIEPLKYDRNETRRSCNLPALQFLEGDARHNVVNKAIECLLDNIKVGDRKHLKSLEWAFTNREPIALRACRIHLSSSGARAMREFPSSALNFDRAAFASDPRLAI